METAQVFFYGPLWKEEFEQWIQMESRLNSYSVA